MQLRLAAQILCTATLSCCFAGGGKAQEADWVRAGLNTNQPLWGIRGGSLWAVPTGGFGSASGPRGLIRVGYPFPGRQLWHYGGGKATQYWKKPHGTARDDLHVAVNARYTYWQTHQPIPGGVAFENFELRERFYEGQTFTFGITRKMPAQLRNAQ